MNDTDFTPATVAGCKALTGQHPADLVATVAECADVLGELEQLFCAIDAASDLAHPRDNLGLALSHIHGLAGAGRRVAADLANYADCQREDLLNALRAPQMENAA